MFGNRYLYVVKIRNMHHCDVSTLDLAYVELAISIVHYTYYID